MKNSSSSYKIDLLQQLFQIYDSSLGLHLMHAGIGFDHCGTINNLTQTRDAFICDGGWWGITSTGLYAWAHHSSPFILATWLWCM